MPAGKTLLLLRHAKSSWDDPRLDDFDRPLARRGLKAAPRMGAEMVRRGWLPARALVSAALRTRQTWDLVAPQLPGAVPAAFDDTIYEAPPGRILAAIRRTPEDVASLVVVGHNPGLQDLATLLAASGSDPGALAALAEKFPTAALARLTFTGGWEDLGEGGARLEAFVTPRQLA